MPGVNTRLSTNSCQPTTGPEVQTQYFTIPKYTLARTLVILVPPDLAGGELDVARLLRMPPGDSAKRPEPDTDRT